MVRKENRELTCVSTPSPQAQGRGNGAPARKSVGQEAYKRKFKVLCLLTAIYGNLKK